MSALENAIQLLRTGDAALTIEFTDDAQSGLLTEQCSFLTLALDIIGETRKAAVITDQNGHLIHCGLYCVETGLVLDAAGIRPVTQQEAKWEALHPGLCNHAVIGIDELKALSPPESLFFSRVLARFDKVAAAHLPKDESAESTSQGVPSVIGYQVHNQDGEQWAGRYSFEILNQETATRDLLAARGNGQGLWLMIAILDGDVEGPVFV